MGMKLSPFPRRKTNCQGEYVDRREEVTVGLRNCVKRRFIICTLYEILLGKSKSNYPWCSCHVDVWEIGVEVWHYMEVSGYFCALLV